MPIYEYQCAKCGYLFEKLQKMSDPAITVCPECQADGVKKLISNTSFQLKGTGWYVTDFRDADKKRAKAKQEQQNTKTSTKDTAHSNSTSATDTGATGTSATGSSAAGTGRADTSSTDTNSQSDSAD